MKVQKVQKASKKHSFYREPISVRFFTVFLCVLFIISLIPMLKVGMYARPSADDFNYSASCRQIWVQSHSVWQTVKEAFATVANRYQTWQGTYVTTFFMALQPGMWKEQLYFLTPLLMLASLMISVFFLVRTLVRRYLQGTGAESLVLSLLILFPAIQCIPNATEAFYWFNGAVNYIVPLASSLAMTAFMLSYYISPENRPKSRLPGAVIFGFVSAGGNLVAGLVTCVFLFLFVLLLIAGHKLKEKKGLCIPVLLYPVFFLINALAPGNFARSAGLTGLHPVKAVLVAFRYALSWPIEVWLDWTVLFFLLLSVPFLWRLVKRSSFSFPCPLLVALSSYCLLSSAFAPNLYATGNIEAGRIQDFIFILFLLLLYFNTGYILGWIRQRFCGTNKPAENSHYLSANESLCVIFTAAMLLFGFILTVIPNAGYYVSTEAVRELASGEAASYALEMDERFVRLNDASSPEVTLAPIQSCPPLLFFSDITPDPANWLNKGVGRFYGKESVLLK